MFNTPTECVPECVPSVSPEAPEGTAERVCPPSPSPTEGDTLSEPFRPCPTTVSQTAICGHRDGPWICNVIGPHDVTPDGRTRHYYRAAA